MFFLLKVFFYCRFKPSTPPVITQFFHTYTCANCGLLESLPLGGFKSVPVIKIPQQSTSVSVFDLFTLFLASFTSQQMQCNCSSCNHVVNGNPNYVKGKFTAISINRLEYVNNVLQPKITTKLSLVNGNGNGALGELICVVSHVVDVNTRGGHWVTYSQVEGNWWMNNDSKVISMCPHHPFETGPNETCDFLVFSNV